jgi:hypothetical protein
MAIFPERLRKFSGIRCGPLVGSCLSTSVPPKFDGVERRLAGSQCADPIDTMKRAIVNSRISTAAFCSALMLTGMIIVGHPGAMASANAGSDSQTTLVSLEDKFFDHSYAQDDESARLNRLEQFIFGSAQSGSMHDRLSKLQAAVAANQPAPSQTPKDATQSANANSPASNSKPAVSPPAFDYSNYPRVNGLEKQLLGTTYAHEPLPQRLDRLEKKAYGEASSSNDLCARVDRLDSYAGKHDIFHERQSPDIVVGKGGTTQPTEDSDDASPPAQNAFVAASQDASGSAQRIAAMEKVMFGRQYDSRPLIERVQHLEKRLVPYEHDLDKKDLASRVDNLWSILKAANPDRSGSLAANGADSYISANLPSASYGGRPAPSPSVTPNQPANQDQSAHHSWLHSLGKAIDSGQTGGGTIGGPNVMTPYRGQGLNGGTFWIP